MVSSFNIRFATQCIQQGGVIAYPTEAVYGLGCDPYQADAVYQILKLKSRPVEKGLILIGSQLQQFNDFIEPLNDQQKTQILNNRTTSWIVPAKDAPFWLRGQHSSLAIRLSAHPLVVRLCDTLDQPIVSTSANPAGRNPARNNLQAHQYFHGQLEMILSDKTGALGRPTEIRDLLTQKILRAN